jgi:hypothetical protein
MSTEFTCEFKKADGAWVKYTLQPESPVYFGREYSRELIKANYPHARYHSPSDNFLNILLSSWQAHAVIEFLPKSDHRVTKSGFYLRIFPKPDSSAPTNPLWSRSGAPESTWTKNAFSTAPILLEGSEQFSIGKKFRFNTNIPAQVTLLNDVAVAAAPAAAAAPTALLNDVAPAPAPTALLNDVAPAPAPTAPPYSFFFGAGAGAGAALHNDVAAEKKEWAHCSDCEYPFGAPICTC